MDANYLQLAAYAGGLAATLVLACYLTPARWWRRPTARNLAIVALGTWGIGAALAHGLDGDSGPQPAQAAAPAPSMAGASFRVYRALNLRAGAGTQSARLAVIPAGALVTLTGERDGDWWQLSADAGGRRHTGWASSLWLRQQTE